MAIGEHSIFYYLLMLLLILGVLQGLAIGFLFFFKKSGIIKANFFYGLLLLAFSLTLAHNILTITGIFVEYPELKFLPIYFTLSLPPLFFFHVKLDLYPNYHLRWSDSKHLILPVGQVLFFLFLFLCTVEYKTTVERSFYNPFFGATEHFLYLTTFFLYLYSAYRYIRYKQLQGKHKFQSKRISYLKVLIKVFLVFFIVHTVFLVSDFVSYEFLNINMRSSKIFAALGALSFGALVVWLGIYGFQVLIWGRKLFYS